MRYSIGEIADRLSIVRLKGERFPEGFDKDEHVAFQDSWEEGLREAGYYLKADLLGLFNDLYVANGEIWDRESAIRQGRENELGLEEVGRRALEIRDWNEKRVAAKNSINKMCGDGFREYKHTEMHTQEYEK